MSQSPTLPPDVGRLAPPIKRLVAYILDSIIPVPVLLFLVTSSIAVLGGETIGPVIMIIAFLILGAYLVVALKLFAQGTTPGKHLLKMRVVKDTGANAGFLTMLLREWIGKYIFSAAVFGLGYFWILIDQNNQGWHDKLMATFVVERE